MGGKRDGSGRFLKGFSGNEDGRPRTKSSTVEGSVKRALGAKVVLVTKDGRRRRVTKQDLAAEQLANKGASGDLRSAKLAFDIARQADAADAVKATDTPPMSSLDQEIADRVIERIKQILREESDP